MGDFLQMRTLTIAEKGLNGLLMRQRVAASNIANVSTPGYKAGTVDFEKQLENAMGKGFSMRATHSGHITPAIVAEGETTSGARLDGNSVNLDREMTTNSETALRYDAVTAALSHKLAKIKMGINSEKFGK